MLLSLYIPRILEDKRSKGVPHATELLAELFENKITIQMPQVCYSVLLDISILVCCLSKKPYTWWS